ncbi:hypothetical protein [Flavobacterium okayamense]|nr:hypothetical protein [Flavobacterium okayamense]
MKKITLLLILFLGLNTFNAQESNSSSHRFELLKQKSSTKILYDRVAQIAELTKEKNVAFPSIYYKQAFHEIQRSDYLNRLPNLDYLEDETEKGFANNLIPISVLIADFEVLKNEVKSQNLIQLNSNNQYEAIDPNFEYFTTHSIGLVSPLIKQLKGKNIEFIVKNELVFNTTSIAIDKIEANFNNQGFKRVNVDEKFTIDFNTIGEKEIIFKTTLKNGKVFTNKVSIEIKEKAQTIDYSANISHKAPSTVGPLTSITSSLTYQGYNEVSAHAGQGEFQIYYDNEAGLLDKIILVCDGFDPADGRDVNSIYGLLNYGNPLQNLGENVRDLGYDVVVLNFPQYTRPDGITNIDGGVDYIQRNARVMIELINYLNANKVGNQELVIIGPSMGGLISRYALRFMEMNGMDHKTRLWLSFDSPHLGANVPIGMQHMFNYIAYDSDISDLTVRAIVESMLKSPAARQMLIDHMEGHLVSTAFDETDFIQSPTTALLPIGHPTHRNVFQTELNTMGFPQNCRKIAISNGAGNGTMTGTPGMSILSGLDVPDSSGFTRALLDLNFAPNTNTNIRVSRIRKQAWTFFWLTIGTGQTNAMSPTTSAGLDSAPGGLFNLESLAADSGGNPTLDRFLNAMALKVFSFIPARSSVGVTSTNNWYANLNSSSGSPFDAFFIPTVNEDHVTLTDNNVAFAMDEIVNNIQLKCQTITNWDGSSWSNGLPAKDKQVTFTGNYTSSSDIEACSISISGSAIVSFQSGHDLTVRGGINVGTTAQLIMQDNANIYQIEEITNSGNVNVNKNVSTKRLDYIGWSSPVANQNLKAFSPNTLDNRFYEYIPTGTTTPTAYNSVNPNTNTFNQAKGYLIRASNSYPSTLTSWNGSFTGTPFNGRINPNTIYGGIGLGYNLVGNPYPSPLNIQELIEGNVNTFDGTLYFWTNTNSPVGGVYTLNNFATRNLTGGTAAVNGSLIPDEYVQTGQGFYVNSLVTGPMYFTNSMRNMVSNNQFINRNSNNSVTLNEAHKFWLNLSEGENKHNEILIGYVPNATNELDFGYDGKLFNNGSSALYSVAQNEELVIQGRSLPFTNDDIIPLGIKTDKSNLFTISLGNVEGLFSENQNIYIKDKVTGAVIDLTKNDYSFIANEGANNYRFEILFKKENEANTNENQTLVYDNGNSLIFDSSNKIKSIEVYDTLGRLLFSKSNVNLKHFETNLILKTNSVLLINLTDENQITTKTKVVF